MTEKPALTILPSVLYAVARCMTGIERYLGSRPGGFDLSDTKVFSVLYIHNAVLTWAYFCSAGGKYAGWEGVMSSPQALRITSFICIFPELQKKGGRAVKEVDEYYIKVGFSRDAKDIFNEIEQVSARYIRSGWFLDDAVIDNSLNYITLFFQRHVSVEDEGGQSEIRD